MAQWGALQPTTLSLRGPDHAEPVSGVRVAGAFFEVLGATPVRGRLFSESELAEGGAKVVLLGYDYWVNTYGDGTDPIGDVVTLNGEPHEVIGIMAEGFEFLMPNQDMFVPLARSPQSAARDQRTVLALGRLRDDASMEQVRTEMLQIASALENEHAETQRGWTVDVYNLRYDVPNQQSRVLFGLLQGSVLLVLPRMKPMIERTNNAQKGRMYPSNRR